MKYTGEVVKFVEKPGFGFIRTSGPDAHDIFFHHKVLLIPGYKTVAPGTMVEFELGENNKGPVAIKVKVLRLPDGTVPSYQKDE